MNKPKSFIKLQKEWYSKLEKDGFKDIEYFDKSMEPRDMMYKEAIKTGKAIQDKFSSTEQYYIEASQFYWNHQFEEDSHKQIWYLHSEGCAYRQISKKLKMPYQQVFKTVNKYKEIMLSTR